MTMTILKKGGEPRSYVFVESTTSPFKVTCEISFFSLRPPRLGGKKIFYLTTEAQRTQSKEIKEEFIDQNFYTLKINT